MPGIMSRQAGLSGIMPPWESQRPGTWPWTMPSILAEGEIGRKCYLTILADMKRVEHAPSAENAQVILLNIDLLLPYRPT